MRSAAQLKRYAIALAGPVGSAIAQFALSLILLKQIDLERFGSFSLLLIVAQFTWGIWSALFCAPLPALLSAATVARQKEISETMRSASFLGAALIFIFFFPLALILNIGPLGAFFFALFGSASLIRWYARAEAYASGQQRCAIQSDLIYSGILMLGLAGPYLSATHALDFAFIALSLAALTGITPFLLGRSAREKKGPILAAIRRYSLIWRQHSRWSLLGVATTEATANAHAYLVTIVYGPAAFAPLAASALLIRPIQVAINAISEYERAKIAKEVCISQGLMKTPSLTVFRAALGSIWALTSIASAIALTYFPLVVFSNKYALSELNSAAALWLAVAAVRMLRTPESILLQAAGRFKPLATASVWSGFISIAAVGLLVITVGPLWSIVGILAGELAYAFLIFLAARLLIFSRSPP